MGIGVVTSSRSSETRREASWARRVLFAALHLNQRLIVCVEWEPIVGDGALGQAGRPPIPQYPRSLRTESLMRRQTPTPSPSLLGVHFLWRLDSQVCASY